MSPHAGYFQRYFMVKEITQIMFLPWKSAAGNVEDMVKLYWNPPVVKLSAKMGVYNRYNKTMTTNLRASSESVTRW